MTKNNPLHIVIFDGSFATTAFINRLVKGLAIQNKVYILGFNEKLTHKLENVHYVPLGSNQNKLRFIFTTLRYAIQLRSVKGFFKVLKKVIRGGRKELQEQNLRFVLNKIQPDVIHLQWPSLIPWLEDELTAQKTSIILSQRGYQNNVKPFLDLENFVYLKNWFPKIAGFHSVSRSILLNSEKIWNSSNKIDRVVYTGLSLDKFHFHNKYKISSTLQLLSVGRTHWKKGYDYALQSCKILKERSIAFHYTIIGGADNEELQFLISDLQIQGCVSLEGRLPQTKVFEHMKNAALFLLPSVEEGLPNVVVEAMALGLPVLSTDCDGVPELIEDGVEGWLVPIRNPEAMADKVEAFSKLPLRKIEEVRVAARNKVEQQHSEEQMITGMVDLYREVMVI